jgi:predicted amino acid-binding ACT domain protein
MTKKLIDNNKNIIHIIQTFISNFFTASFRRVCPSGNK